MPLESAVVRDELSVFRKKERGIVEADESADFSFGREVLDGIGGDPLIRESGSTGSGAEREKYE